MAIIVIINSELHDQKSEIIIIIILYSSFGLLVFSLEDYRDISVVIL